jgi:LemA protein
LLNAKTPEESIAAANRQSSALGRLLAVVENYPQLKANEQFNRLMDELSGTENRLAVERMRYNERVQEYNTSRRQFPANLTAKMFGFKEYPFFEAPAEAKQVPKVNFGKQPS